MVFKSQTACNWGWLKFSHAAEELATHTIQNVGAIQAPYLSQCIDSEERSGFSHNISSYVGLSLGSPELDLSMLRLVQMRQAVEGDSVVRFRLLGRRPCNECDTPRWKPGQRFPVYVVWNYSPAKCSTKERGRQRGREKSPLWSYFSYSCSTNTLLEMGKHVNILQTLRCLLVRRPTYLWSFYWILVRSPLWDMLGFSM